MEELEKATQAIAAGNHREAHLLLARVIKSHPNNVDAWLMLSQTAATPEQKITFLKRALLIEPDHPTARAQLAILEGDQPEAASPPAVASTPQQETAPEATTSGHSPAGEEEATVPWEPLPVSDNPFDYEVQAKGETVPPWLAGEGEFTGSRAAPVTTPADTPTIQDTPVPDWLKSDLEETWLEQNNQEQYGPAVWKSEEIAAPTVSEKSKEAAAAAKPPRSRQRATTAGRTSTMEWALALLFIVLFLVIVYVALSVV